MKNLLLALLALAAAGCATRETATLLVPSDEPSGFTLISVNTTLAKAAEPTELKRGFAADGVTPKFRLILQNTTGSAQRVNYRVEWMDAQDMTLRGQTSPAQTLVVPSGSVGIIEAVAPSAAAKRFRLWLTEAAR